MEEEILDAGYDQKTIFNYKSSEIWDWIEELPTKIQLNRTKSWSQFLDKRTYKACGKYSLMHCINEEYLEENDPRNFRFKHNWESWLLGSWIKDNISDALKDWLIAWYFECDSIIEVKKALNRKHLIATGTNSCDWSKVKNDFMFHYMKWWAGHLICIEGYDDEKWWFIVRDSMWDTTPKRDKWRFYIKYEDFKYLFTCYEIIDIENKALIDKFKKMESNKIIERLKKLWITNWNDLDKPITREQTFVLLGRMLDLLTTEAGQNAILNTK